MVEIVNTPCSWVITKCADKSVAEYTKYINISPPPPLTHTLARTQMHSRTRMHARTHTSWTSAPLARWHSYLILSILFLPSFRCNTLSIYRSTLTVVSIKSLERDGLHQAEFCPCYIMDNRPNVGFLVHKDMGSAVLGCRPVSSRLISIRLRAPPFNVTIIQVYAPISLRRYVSAGMLERRNCITILSCKNTRNGWRKCLENGI